MGGGADNMDNHEKIDKPPGPGPGSHQTNHFSEYDLDLEFADFYPTKQSNPSFETTPPSQPTNEPTDQFLSEHTNQMMQPICPTASLADQSVNRSTVSLTEQLVNRSTSNVIINQPSNQQPVFHPANEDQQVNEGPGQLINEGPGQRINEGPGQRINDGPLQRINEGPGQRINDGPLHRVNEGPVQLIDYATHPIQASEYNQDQSSSFTQTFLRGILTSLDSRDPVVANAWLETLLDAIDLLPINVIKAEIVGIAISKSQLSQPAFSRMAAAKILGKLSTKLDHQSVRQEVLPPTLALCQDVESVVRNCMCRHLALISRGVGLDLTKSAILPVLVELSNDESAEVRLSSIETVVHLLSLLDDEVCTTTIVPLVINSCQQAKTLDDRTLPVLARHLGRLCHGLTPNLNAKQKTWFIEYYQSLAVLGVCGDRSGQSTPMPDLVPKTQEDQVDRNSECRDACAFNLPGMILFVGPANFSEQLLPTFKLLAADPCPAVRRTIAASLQQLIRIIGSKFSCLKDEIVGLFCDCDVSVLACMVTNMVYVIDALARFGVLQSGSTGSYSQELSLSILHMEEIISNTRNWRLHADCLEKLSCLANCISATVIQNRYIPLLFTRALKSRPLPCRVGAVRTLLVILRFTVKQADRTTIINRIKNELAHGRSCHARMLFLKMCEMAVVLFSRAYFKTTFFHQFLALYQDRVANVRLRVVSLLPQLKSLICMPSDNSLLNYLEEVVKDLLVVETDRDVLNALQEAIDALADIETGVDEQPMVGPGLRGHLDDDRDDERKLREEKLIANMEEQIKQVQGTNFDQLATPSAIPSRLRSLGLDRKRSESLPPALTRAEAQSTKTRFNSPEPPRYSAGSSKHFSPELSRRAIWSTPEKEEEEVQGTMPSSLNTPYSSSLENLDPNTQEFLVDAGIKLPTSVGNMSSAASMPNLTSIGKLREPPLVHSNSIPDNHNLDGELSKYLISNKEMQLYEAEYIKAASELTLEPHEPKVSPEPPSPKLRGRTDKRIRPPSFTSALTNKVTKGDGEYVIKHVSTPDKEEPARMLGSVSNKSSLSRISPPKEEGGRSSQKWNDGSIERMAEKWAAKRDSLLKETWVVTGTSHQRKLAMEQRLESVKRSIPKRNFGFTSDLVQKRLSLGETPPLQDKQSEIKRKSLDIDVVLPPQSTDSDEDEEDPQISRKLGQIRDKHSASPDHGRKYSPELGSSDSDDSLPPYPTFEKQRLNISIDDQPLPPPPPSLDSIFNIPELEAKSMIPPSTNLLLRGSSKSMTPPSTKLLLSGSSKPMQPPSTNLLISGSSKSMTLTSSKLHSDGSSKSMKPSSSNLQLSESSKAITPTSSNLLLSGSSKPMKPPSTNLLLRSESSKSMTPPSTNLLMSGSSTPSYRMVTAPQTSVAISRSIQPPQRIVVESTLVKKSLLSTPSKLDSIVAPRNLLAPKFDSKMNHEKNASTPTIKPNQGQHQSPLANPEANLANMSCTASPLQKVMGKKLEMNKPGTHPSSDQRKPDITTSSPSKPSFSSSLFKPSVTSQKQISKPELSLTPSVQTIKPKVKPPTKSSDVVIMKNSAEKPHKTVVYIKPSTTLGNRTRELKPPQTLQTKSLNRSVSPQSNQPNPPQTASVRRGRFGGKTFSVDSILDQNDNEEAQPSLKTQTKITQSQGSSEGSSRGSTPPGDILLTPDSLESFSPAVTPQSPGSNTITGRTGIVGPRKSSGMRMWHGQLGSARRSSKSPNASRSPSPSNKLSLPSPLRKTETLPRASNMSRMKTPTSQNQTQRRSYGGTIGQPSGPSSHQGGKYLSAPNTPRHSRNDLRQAGSSPNSPGQSRSASPAMTPEVRRRSAHYPTSGQYEMNTVPIRTFSEKNLLKTKQKTGLATPNSRTLSQPHLLEVTRTSVSSFSPSPTRTQASAPTLVQPRTQFKPSQTTKPVPAARVLQFSQAASKPQVFSAHGYSKASQSPQPIHPVSPTVLKQSKQLGVAKVPQSPKLVFSKVPPPPHIPPSAKVSLPPHIPSKVSESPQAATPLPASRLRTPFKGGFGFNKK